MEKIHRQTMKEKKKKFLITEKRVEFETHDIEMASVRNEENP